MPFLTEYDEDIDAGAKSLRTELARRESAKNIVAALHNDLSATRMYVQEVDPETGFPVRKTLVSGGLEYFNDHGTPTMNATAYNIDAILSNDMSINDAMVAFAETKAATTPQPVPPLAAPVSHQTNPDDALRLLGFDFIHAVPTMPNKQVQLSLSGPMTFQVPLACHSIVCTDSLVILVTDKRSVPTGNAMDCNVNRDAVQATLIFPDKTVVPIVAPVPRTVTFELGILCCTLFVRR